MKERERNKGKKRRKAIDMLLLPERTDYIDGRYSGEDFRELCRKELKRIVPLVDAIEALEPEMKAMSDAELREMTDRFKQRLINGETLDDILPEAYAVVREAAARVIGERHYRVQLMGGIVLHQGRIAEMKTGEGKTLTATLPLYLNALEGKGAHL